MQMLYIATIVILVAAVVSLFLRLRDLRVYASAKEDETLSLRGRLSYVEQELDEEKARGEGYKKLMKIKDTALEEAKGFFDNLPRGVANDKQENIKVSSPAPVVQKPKAAPARRQETVPQRPSRVTHTDTPSQGYPIHHGHVYDDQSFSRDSGVCSTSSRSDSYDSGSSSSYDSGSSSSGGGCD